MQKNNRYWKGLEELNKEPEFLKAQKDEFAEGLPLDEVLSETDLDLSSNRRDFLKFFGFSVTAVALAACNKAPVKNVIPYVIAPDTTIPGVANWYASTCGGCSVGCSVLVKTKDGRPIKIEGNASSPLSQGGLCASGQASVFNLYDNERLANPLVSGNEMADWAKIDAEIINALGSVSAAGSSIAIVTPTITSPSVLEAIKTFKAKYPTAKHITYDAVSYSGMLEANKQSFDKAVIPSYDFSKAEVIVSFAADFLGTWLSPVEFTKQYSKTRKVSSTKKTMSKHFQFESTLTISGTSADYRAPMKESEEGAAVVTLYNELAKLAKAAGYDVNQIPAATNKELAGNMIGNAAKALWAAKGKSLVIAKSNNPSVQVVVNHINALLENYGTTIDMVNHSNQYQGIDSEFDQFVNSGSYKAVILHGVNPAYTYKNPEAFKKALASASLVVSTASSNDETAALAKYVTPDNHYLESWGDSNPRKGLYSLMQPTITPVFNTRQFLTSILTWSGTTVETGNDNPDVAYNYIRKVWLEQGYPYQTTYSNFETYWTKTLETGILDEGKKEVLPVALNTNPADALSGIQLKGIEGIELVKYQKVGMRDGSMANNPWLQELPDPISRATWDNYAALGKLTADNLGVKDGDVVTVSDGTTTIKLPVLVQPGQVRNTVSVALGYGRTAAGKVGNGCGQNVYPLNDAVAVTVAKVEGETYELAQVQTHHTIEGRDIIREATLEDYKKDEAVSNHIHLPGIMENGKLADLWEVDHLNKKSGHRWAMMIDMNSCTGCSACVISCSAENNVPVIGREEVRRRRIMHWIRIDRYYRFNPNTASKDDHHAMGVSREKQIEHLPAEDFENVSTMHQPMLCQHCGHAPCETVCPVLATTHSSEGLNQMTYNRCIGTKYCANNCPYKVRRFNWFRFNDNDDFDYHYNNDLGKMVINPDVTVRTRGVMEKCTFCVQRIQEGKLAAKREGRRVQDGDIKTACQQSCPADAIIFGDLNDEKSEISKVFNSDKRGYQVLQEINVQPSIKYQVRIRNNDNLVLDGKKSAAAHH